jgi:hypothetical protein
MSAEMSGEQMQAKIAAARRDAEGLKDKIKRKKDELADTSCKLGICFNRPGVVLCVRDREPTARHEGH